MPPALAVERLAGRLGGERALHVARGRSGERAGRRAVPVGRAAARADPRTTAEGHCLWVIVGGESGPGHRPIRPEWVRAIRDQCAGAGVAFFFKQWGGSTPKAGGRTLDGQQWSEMPDTPRAPVASLF
jgi:Protein of unknown function (DUF5131)